MCPSLNQSLDPETYVFIWLDLGPKAIREVGGPVSDTQSQEKNMSGGEYEWFFKEKCSFTRSGSTLYSSHPHLLTGNVSFEKKCHFPRKNNLLLPVNIKKSMSHECLAVVGDAEL